MATKVAKEERGFHQVRRSCRAPSRGEKFKKGEHLSLDSLSSCSSLTITIISITTTTTSIIIIIIIIVVVVVVVVVIVIIVVVIIIIIYYLYS